MSETLPMPVFTKPASYNKVKRISVEVRLPGSSFDVEVLRLEKGGNAGWVIVLPAVHSREHYKPARTLSAPYPLKKAKQLAAALVMHAVSHEQIQTLRDCQTLPAWAQKAKESIR